MPNNLPGWCNGHGNPTKAEQINTLINAVKKCEVRGEGAPSRATRPLTQAEFRKEMELLPKHKDDLADRVGYRTMGLWQYHLIGRLDDTAHAKMCDPKTHDRFDFALKTRVSWSNNV